MIPRCSRVARLRSTWWCLRKSLVLSAANRTSPSRPHRSRPRPRNQPSPSRRPPHRQFRLRAFKLRCLPRFLRQPRTYCLSSLPGLLCPRSRSLLRKPNRSSCLFVPHPRRRHHNQPIHFNPRSPSHRQRNRFAPRCRRRPGRQRTLSNRPLRRHSVRQRLRLLRLSILHQPQRPLLCLEALCPQLRKMIWIPPSSCGQIRFRNRPRCQLPRPASRFPYPHLSLSSCRLLRSPRQPQRQLLRQFVRLSLHLFRCMSRSLCATSIRPRRFLRLPKPQHRLHPLHRLRLRISSLQLLRSRRLNLRPFALLCRHPCLQHLPRLLHRYPRRPLRSLNPLPRRSWRLPSLSLLP